MGRADVRRAVCVLLAVLLLCVPAWAVALDPSVLYDSVEDGQTVSNIGVFKHKNVALPQLYRDRLTEFFTFPRNRCMVFYRYEEKTIEFILLDTPLENASFDCRASSIILYGDASGSLSFTRFVWSYPDLNLRSWDTQDTTFYDAGALISSTVPYTIVKDDQTDCFVDHRQTILFHDDLGDDTGAVEEEKKGVLEWLGDFWGRFLDALKSLFIPEEGYFQGWAEELREAFAAKTGGLSSVADRLKDSFEGIKDGEGKGPSLVITYPAGFFGPGTGEASGDLLGLSQVVSFARGILNAAVAMLTIYICARKLMDLIQQ